MEIVLDKMYLKRKCELAAMYTEKKQLTNEHKHSKKSLLVGGSYTGRTT